MGASSDLAPAGTGDHQPVLLAETLAGLAIRPQGRYIDATVGGGGHARAILEASTPDGLLLGLDRDPEAAQRTAERLASFGERVQILHRSFVELAEAAHETNFSPVDGIVFDLGFSSFQIDDPGRGFSFRSNGPLDMRFDPTGDAPTAAELVNSLSEQELVRVLRTYGEEPRSGRIARAIVAARPISTTRELADVIYTAVGRRAGEIHPATLTFQALRIAVNGELDLVAAALPQAVALLRPGGRLAVISFHSLEDRLVKQFMQQESRGCICPPKAPVCTCHHKPTLQLITRKPEIPSEAESVANPRSRSAKLRVAEKLESG